MTSLYIHIPFCSKKCHYCNFAVLTDTSLKDAYLQRLFKERDHWLEKLPHNSIHTIYLGGGTPSLLTSDEIFELLSPIFAHTSQEHIAEISMELNPENVTKEYIQELLGVGVTRFSVGVQSLDNQSLITAGRNHSVNMAIQAMSTLATLGVNWSADLILGLPGNSMNTQSVDTVLKYQPKHISLYDLTIEKDTPFALLPKDQFLNDDTSIALRDKYISQLQDAAYVNYEISNLALPGYESKHNMVYWTGGEYIGLGLSSSSYYDGKLWSNYRNMRLYLERKVTFNSKTVYVLSKEEQGDLYFMGVTRLLTPISYKTLAPFYKSDWDNKEKVLELLEKQGLISIREGELSMTSLGRTMHNYVVGAFSNG